MVRPPIKKITAIIISLTIGVILIFISLNFFVFSTSSVCDDAYLASYLDKRDLLLTTDSPRLILVGDSVFAFSVDSETLSNTFGLPVVNTGIYGSMGIYYWMTLVEPYVRQGDIVLLSTSYKHWIDARQLDVQFFGTNRKSSSWLLALLDISTIRNITHQEQLKIFIDAQLQALNERLKNGLFVSTPCINDTERLSRWEFNEYGDYIGHLADIEDQGRNLSRSMLIKPIDEEFFSLTNDIVQRMTAKGTSVYFIPPSLAESTYRTNQDALDNFLPAMREGLEFSVLGSVVDFVYPDHMMYDTEYHTNRIGREINTGNIIMLLSENIDSLNLLR